MDLITQGLLGSTVAQAACSEKLGRRAALYGFIVGLFPDFDIITGFLGPWVSLKYHRGPTHSFMILPLLAYPIGILCKKIARSEVETRHWVTLAFISLITHPVIDWFTSYGTCLFWPLTNRRYAFDALSIIDPLYSFPLLLVTMAGMIGIFSRKKMMQGAICALILTTLYASWGFANSQNLIKAGREIFQNKGFEPVEIRATPTLMNIFVFRVIGRDAQNRYMLTYMRPGYAQPIMTPMIRESANDEYAKKALAHKHGKLFKWFAMDMIQLDSIVEPDGRHSVYMNDMRYGLMLSPQRTLFSAKASFDKAGNLISLSRVHNRSGVDMKEELKTTLHHAFPWLFNAPKTQQSLVKKVGNG